MPTWGVDLLGAANLITTCHEEFKGGERCRARAEFVLWGKLFPPDALGPRCYDHAVDRTNRSMPSMVTQWAVIDLRPIIRMVGKD